MVACLRNQSKTHAHGIKNTKNQKKTSHIATNGGLPAEIIKKPMRIASKAQQNQQITNSNSECPVCENQQQNNTNNMKNTKEPNKQHK